MRPTASLLFWVPVVVSVGVNRLRREADHYHHLVAKFNRLKTKHNRLYINPLNAELNPIFYLLALLGAHHFLHVSRIRVKSLILRLLMSYIYIWSTYS